MPSSGSRSSGRLSGPQSRVAACRLCCCSSQVASFLLTQLELNPSGLLAGTDGGRLSGAQPGVFQGQTC